MSDVILHEAHVRVFRCRNAAPWLATRRPKFRAGYLGEVKRKRGDWEHELLMLELEAVFAPKRVAFSSRMDAVRKAVFG